MLVKYNDFEGFMFRDHIRPESAETAAKLNKLYELAEAEAAEAQAVRDLEAKRASEEKAARIAEAKRASEKKAARAAEARREQLIQKYGRSNGEAIFAGKIWLGITSEMARDSWGMPIDVNRTVDASGTREQWVYRGHP